MKANPNQKGSPNPPESMGGGAILQPKALYSEVIANALAMFVEPNRIIETR